MEPNASLISRRVRGLLAEHQVSGSELARRAGLSQSYVSRRVRGVVAWTISDLELIAAELDIPLSAILPVEQKAA